MERRWKLLGVLRFSDLVYRVAKVGKKNQGDYMGIQGLKSEFLTILLEAVVFGGCIT